MRQIIISVAALAAATFILAVAGCGNHTGTACDGDDCPVRVCHLLVCCRVGANLGSTFLVNGEWNPAHDYRDIGQVRDILQKIKDEYSGTDQLDESTKSYLNERYSIEWDRGELHQGTLIVSADNYDEFISDMEQIRKNELFR